MSQRTDKTKESHYICGQCGEEVYYVIGKKEPDKCPECGWRHKSRKKYSVPSEVRLSLKKY
jgi:rubrerythrin